MERAAIEKIEEMAKLETIEHEGFTYSTKKLSRNRL